MADNSELFRYGDLTHDFHEKYRTTGIALGISLAAIASAESWWFYGLLESVRNARNLLNVFLYLIVIISAVSVLVSSFILQFRHYDGMKHMARSYFNLYKLIENKGQDGSWDADRKREWDIATDHFDKADKVVVWLKRLAIANLSAAILYMVLYHPPVK